VIATSQRSCQQNKRDFYGPPARLRGLRRGQGVSVYNRGNLVDYGWILDATKTANVWIPVCCERVMRFNIFVQKTGTPYGSLVCTVCNKSVSFELEHQVDLNQYGDGAKAISVLGSPKPPKDERRRVDHGAAVNDQTI
jgi:hypothetical protein